MTLILYLSVCAASMGFQALYYSDDNLYFNEWFPRALARTILWPIYACWGLFIIAKLLVKHFASAMAWAFYEISGAKKRDEQKND